MEKTDQIGFRTTYAVKTALETLSANKQRPVSWLGHKGCIRGCKKTILICQINLLKMEFDMRSFLAVFVPWFVFFTIGRPFSAIFCLILQLTLVGWIPAIAWAIYALSQFKTDKKIKKASKKIKKAIAGQTS